MPAGRSHGRELEMSQLTASPRSRAAHCGTRRCWTCIAVGAALFASAVGSAREPGQGLTLAAPESPADRPRNDAVVPPFGDDAPAFPVRSAGWLETVDGTTDSDAAAGDHRQRVTPIGGERTTNVSAPAKLNVPAAEPLSRLAWPDSSRQFDPGQTLKEWGEGAGLIVAFGVVALWLLRQWVSRRDLPGGSMSHLRTIESLSLPQRCRIHLVEVDGRHVLVAADAAGVKSVTVLPDRFAALLAGAEGHPEPGIAQLAELPESDSSPAWHGLHESKPA